MGTSNFVDRPSMDLRKPTMVPIEGESIEVTFLGITKNLASISVIGEAKPRVLQVK